VSADIGPLFEQAAKQIRAARHVVALTGAGISTPSGIPDFRSPHSGLWRGTNPFVVASLYGFRLRPKRFYDWIRPLAQQVWDAEPNLAHVALARLEDRGLLQAVITQNVDGLHQKAGSGNVIEVHGHIRQATCMRCRHSVPSASILDQFVESDRVPVCARCGGLLKPDVVLFGERLPSQAIDAARREAQTCDLMLVAGTSLWVPPAANLPYLAQARGAQLIVVNDEPTPIDDTCVLVIRADVAVALPGIVAHLA
jgi:NAD-dependent deacetylase